MATEALIIDGLRTPIGRRGGALRDWHSVDLLAHVLKALVARTGIDPAEVDDVICGCVTQTGEQSYNIGRNGGLAARLPVGVPATTVDRQCGSSQQAVHFAAHGILAGSYDLAVACGIESMTRTPLGKVAEAGNPLSDLLLSACGVEELREGIGAELIADDYGLDRETLDAYSMRSHRLAAAARDAGLQAGEILPVPVGDGELTADEGIRDPDPAKIASLKPAFREDGSITAASSSQISDGAGAILLASREAAERLGLRARGRVHAMAVAGDDPVRMLTAPIPATRKVLARAGMAMNELDFVEINEAFASIPLAWQQALELDDAWFDERVNPRGGAIAVGHPVGASGVRLMLSLLGTLEQHDGRYGLQTMCEGMGLANATVIERLS